MKPTGRLVALALSWAVVGLWASLHEAGLAAFGVFGWLLVGSALIDAHRLRVYPALQVARRLPQALSLGERAAVVLTLGTARAERVTVFDAVPDGLHAEGLPAELSLAAGSQVELTYQVRPASRGDVRFEAPHVQRTAPWGLWCTTERPLVVNAVRVYPSFRNVAHYAGLSLGPRARQAGMHLQRRRGQGLEFHQLREFREGDALGQVDWKSVARRQALISREYREERDQRVVFALDCGRRMRAKDGEHTLFDQALNALLLLAHVALRQGDSVGVLTFSGAARFRPPVRGPGGLRQLLEAVYDLDSSPAPSDYAEAAYRLAVRQRRRALVVLLTNLGDDDTSELVEALAPLRKKHLVLVASVRDPALRVPLETNIHDVEQALTAMSTWAYLGARRGTREVLRRHGVRAFEVEPHELPAALVRQYVSIKRAGVL